MERFKAGTIVIVDWRGGALAKEPNKLCPAVVVEDDGLFGPNYPNVIVVPLTEDADPAIPDLSVVIDPTPQNGCTKRCYAPSAIGWERVYGPRAGDRVAGDGLSRCGGYELGSSR